MAIFQLLCKRNPNTAYSFTCILHIFVSTFLLKFRLRKSADRTFVFLDVNRESIVISKKIGKIEQKTAIVKFCVNDATWGLFWQSRKQRRIRTREKETGYGMDSVQCKDGDGFQTLLKF